MRANVWRISEMLGEKVTYCVPGSPKSVNCGSGIKTLIAIDIPDRFLPSDDLEGNVYLKMNGPDGKYSLLENALDADIFGQPILKWYDDKLKCTRTITLGYTTDFES